MLNCIWIQIFVANKHCSKLTSYRHVRRSVRGFQGLQPHETLRQSSFLLGEQNVIVFSQVRLICILFTSWSCCIRDISISTATSLADDTSLLASTHSHPKIMEAPRRESGYDISDGTLTVLGSTLGNIERRFRYHLDISWSHSEEQKHGRLSGFLRIFNKVISLIRVFIALPNHNCQHANRLGKRNVQSMSSIRTHVR